MAMPVTPSQTVGPFLRIGLDWLNSADLGGSDVPGERFTIEGRVLDADGEPVPDALLEFWLADPQGTYGEERERARPDSRRIWLV